MPRAHHRAAALLLGLGTLHASMHCAHADPRSPVQGDPVQTLPRIAAPRPENQVTVQVERPDQALQNLLASRLTPKGFQIEGVKSIPFPEVAAKFAPLAGKEITVAELLKAADEVTAMYAERGFPLSFAFVPAQTFENGNVQVTVVEGYVSKVTVHGNAGPVGARLAEIAERLKGEQPLSRESFEHYVAVLGLQPGVQVAATVQPPTTTDGASEMVLDVRRKPFTFGTGIDYMSPGIRGIATATTNGLTPLGEQISASALFPKGRDSEEYYAASYAQPFGTEGMLGRLFASHYRGKPENSTLTPIGFESRYVNDVKRFGGTVSYPVLLNERRSLTVTGGVYASQQFERYAQANSDRRVTIGTNVRVVNVEGAWIDRKPGQIRTATLGLFKGIDGMGASRDNNVNDLGFFRTRLLVSQANDLPAGFGTRMSAAGQYSGSKLASSEQISFGGRYFGLGYPAGEVAGDKGWAFSAELNRAFQFDTEYFRLLQPYVAWDMARVLSNSFSLSHRSLESVAIGLRFSDNKRYSLDVSVAQPVGDKPVNASHRSPRLNMTYSYQFD